MLTYTYLIQLFLQTTFKIDDIEIPEMPGMFTSILVGPKKVPLFVDPRDFSDTHHYARFMGFDKPIDISFVEPEEANAVPAIEKHQKDEKDQKAKGQRKQQTN